MCGIPIEIADEEKIVRAIMCPCHIKKGKNTLKPAAFRSRAGTDEVSVVRQTHMGSDFCKAKAQEIAGGGHGNEYAGLAVLFAAQIRKTSSTVHDSREEYCGHAHVSHGIILLPGEPLESTKNIVITERCRALANAARYHPDPAPTGHGWSGSAL